MVLVYVLGRDNFYRRDRIMSISENVFLEKNLKYKIMFIQTSLETFFTVTVSNQV